MRRATMGSIAQALLLLSLVAGGSSAPHDSVASGPIIAVVPIPPRIVAVDARTGRAFVASSPDGVTGQVTALDEATGQVEPPGLNTAQSIQGLDVDARRGHIFVTTAPELAASLGPGTVLMLDERTRAVVRRTHIGAGAAPVAFDQAQGHLFLVTGDAASTGYLNTIDTATGRLLRTVKLGKIPLVTEGRGAFGQALDTMRGRLFVATCYTPPSAASVQTHCMLSVLDTISGRLLRTILLGAYQAVGDTLNMTLDDREGDVFVDGPNRILELDESTGRVVHSFVGGTWTEDSRTGRLFDIVTRPSRVLTLDVRTGRLLRAARLPESTAGDYSLTALSATGRVFVVARTARGAGEVDYLSTLDAATGRLVRTVNLGNRAFGNRAYRIEAVDPRTSRVFLTASSPLKNDQYAGLGAIAVADGRTGQIRARVAIGQNPQDMIIDPRTGVAFVLDAESMILLAASFGIAPPPSGHGHGSGLAGRQTSHAQSGFPRAIALAGFVLAIDERDSRAFVGGLQDVSMLYTHTHHLFVLADTHVIVLDATHLTRASHIAARPLAMAMSN